MYVNKTPIISAMREYEFLADDHHDVIDETKKKKVYSRLSLRFTGLTLVCSLAPLLLAGWFMNLHYSNFARAKMLHNFQTQIEHHSRIIELFLRERRSKLELIAQSHSMNYLSDSPNLFHIFEVMNQEYGSITDLGVIDDHGKHLAYIGPYDLLDKNYSDSVWFSQVMKKGTYISDMFMGFRRVPHFIMAVTRLENGKRWILRATIDTEAFRSLVEDVKIGDTGEVYLLNKEGIFQTTPRFSGTIMGKSSDLVNDFHDDIRILEKANKDGRGDQPREIVAQKWLKEVPWVLIVKQGYAEAFDDVNHANFATLIFLHLCALTILIVSVFITKYMIKLIKKKDREADQLNRQLLQASKLASIGELSAGVAHEINNPLAIILTEKQILLDHMTHALNLDEELEKQLTTSLSQVGIQVQRCKRITQNLLRFSRRTRSVIEPVDINQFLKEVMDLMEREAMSNGVTFIYEPDKNLFPLTSDPSQLQQVFLNLITNAIDAHDGIPFGTVRVSTRGDSKKEGVVVIVADTGTGISRENLERIFDPFFTTKPVGKGTGLGLSICYSIVKSMGGDITVESEKGKGTEFRLFFPYQTPLRPDADGARDNPISEG
jgi:two-component system NtrC family sensor kinase